MSDSGLGLGALAIGEDGHTHETACLNCATPLVGSHCHACGQAAHVHRTLGAFFHDLLHGVFHFEGRIWHTLPLLAWQPGELTRRYVDGQRVRFVSPLALFLFSVFLMFAVFHQVRGEWHWNPAMGTDGKSLAQGKAEAQRTLARLEAQRADLVRQHRRTESIDDQIDSQKTALDVIASVSGPQGQGDGPRVNSDIPQLAHVIEAFRANPGLAVYKLQSYAYKYSWALIPISVPMLWLLFPFSRRFQLYDHTVFVTYSLSFMTLLIVLLMLADWLGLPGIALVAVGVPPLHIYRQLRGAYGCGRWGALWRTGALLVFALVALLLFAAVILAQAGAE
jgi:hypothetical protein